VKLKETERHKHLRAYGGAQSEICIAVCGAGRLTLRCTLVRYLWT